MITTLRIVGFLLVAAITSLPGATLAATAAPTNTSTPIRTQADLERYLRTTPPGTSPLDAFPAGARKRFLLSLHIGPHGLRGLSPGDLAQYLTDAQIRAVLALFGLEKFVEGIHGRTQALTAEQRSKPESALEQRYDRFYQAEADHAGAAVPAHYDALLAPLQKPALLARTDDDDLLLLWRAAGTTSSWSHATRHLDDMRRDLDELHRRGLATPERVSVLRDQFVAARDFEGVTALAKAFPDAGLTSLPPVHTASPLPHGAPTMLRFSDDGHSLLRESVDMNAPLRIVVVASCHFSQDAARAIHADAKLDKLFREHAIWLAPDDESLDATRDWNHEFPSQPIHIAWRNDEWPMLDSWAQPTFYVFRRGKLVSQWNGWPGDGEGMGQLHAGLRKAGVQP